MILNLHLALDLSTITKIQVRENKMKENLKWFNISEST